MSLNTINSRYLSPNETEFAEKLLEEIDLFNRKQRLKSVLVFPPLLRRYRYLFHELTQRYFGQTFGTISVGTEGNRRPLLYYKSVIESIEMSENAETDPNCEHFADDLPHLVSNAKHTNHRKNGKHLINDRRHRRPDMKLYVPPKAKNSCLDSDSTDSTATQDKSCVEDLDQKTCETVESLSELEITDSSLERHKTFVTNSTNPNESNESNQSNEELDEQNIDIKTTNSETTEENSWDSMFDENGDCIRSEFVDKVNDLICNKNSDLKLEKSRIDYLSFQYNEPEIDSSEFGHILEVYDFPKELKTQDIMTAISVFNCRDFDIKWVDETHALLVFSNSNAANEALKYIYPNMKLRPLSQGIRESKVKARKCSEFLQPYKQRPQTSASLARRLVTQSLGLRDRITPEQRAAERKKLAEAKERKRLAVKQGQDVWEGNV